MTKNIAAGLKEFKQAQAMVRQNDKAVYAMEKSLVKEEVKSSLTLQEKRIFSRMGADNELGMMLFQDFLFAGVGINLFSDNMLEMLGATTAANAAFIGSAAQVTQEVIVESYEDKRKKYLAEQKADMLQKQREYDAQQQQENELKRKNSQTRTWMFFLLVVMGASIEKWAEENTFEARNDNEEMNDNNNVVSLFNENKTAARKAEPHVKANTNKGLKLALGM